MYIAQLDISSENTEIEVKEFANGLGCTAILAQEFGPAGGNPLYIFESKNYNNLDELVRQVIGDADEETIKTVIIEASK